MSMNKYGFKIFTGIELLVVDYIKLEILIILGYLPDKQLDSYTTFFNLLNTAISSYGYELSAQSIMSDFEINIRKAAVNVGLFNIS